MADTNKIKYGIENVHYAVATIAADGSATYGTPKRLPGAVSLSLDPQGDTNPFYADNIAYYVTVANNGYEGDFELAKIPEDFLVDVLGYKRDSNGVLLEDPNAGTVSFALLFQFEGDVFAKRHVIYRCAAARPSVSGSTKTEQIEPQTETISLTVTSVYNPDIDADVVKATANPVDNATQYNAWFSAVYQSTAMGS